jgi:GT2 family glycosyltransferase
MNWLTAESRHIGAFKSVSDVKDSIIQVESVERQMDYVLGASMLANRRWITTVGLLSEDYFLFYEEADWALRGRRAGLKIGYAPNVRLLHKEGASIGTAPSGGSPFSIYHLTKSRLVFSRANLPLTHLPIIGVNVLYKSLKHLLKGEYKQCRACVSGALDGWGK